VHEIRAHVTRKAGTLALTYRLAGDPAAIRIPRPRAPRSAHRLWQHTCCECFVAVPGSPAYHEFNFSPSGEWQAHAFASYREGAPLEDDTLDPDIAFRDERTHLVIEARVPLEPLSAAHRTARLLIGLSVVVEDTHGALSYWALRHPAGKPDFHHPESFALDLDEIRH
jgi:hypothetical protein